MVVKGMGPDQVKQLGVSSGRAWVKPEKVGNIWEPRTASGVTERQQGHLPDPQALMLTTSTEDALLLF